MFCDLLYGCIYLDLDCLVCLCVFALVISYGLADLNDCCFWLLVNSVVCVFVNLLEFVCCVILLCLVVGIAYTGVGVLLFVWRFICLIVIIILAFVLIVFVVLGFVWCLLSVVSLMLWSRFVWFGCN